MQQLDGVELVVEDEESILTEAVQRRARQPWLSWHYRSQDESLIAFSNEQYYENRLSSFPAPPPEPDSHGRPTAGLSLVRVPGTFLRSGGRQGCCAPTRSRRRRSSPRSAAGSTLSPDRSPVDRRGHLQRPAARPHRVAAPRRRRRAVVEALDGTDGEGLFVKNLENVQGDERDVVLFSMAFTKNDKACCR